MCNSSSLSNWKLFWLHNNQIKKKMMNFISSLSTTRWTWASTWVGWNKIKLVVKHFEDRLDHFVNQLYPERFVIETLFVLFTVTWEFGQYLWNSPRNIQQQKWSKLGYLLFFFDSRARSRAMCHINEEEIDEKG